MEKRKEGLGDKVEKAIQTTFPKLAESKKDCERCNKRRVWLNNIGAIFS